MPKTCPSCKTRFEEEPNRTRDVAEKARVEVAWRCPKCGCDFGESTESTNSILKRF